MLASRPFTRKPMPERKPMAWPGVQAFVPATRADGAGVAQPKTVEHRNPALLAMACGKPCLLQVPAVCNNDPRTTVACHSNFSIHGKGGARKADDQYSVWGCSACHAWLDRGRATKAVKQATFMRAHIYQVLAWRRIARNTTFTAKERAAANWALQLLDASPTGETP